VDPTQEYRPPETDRIPVKRLLLVLILLIAAPIVIVALMTRPDEQPTNAPSTMPAEPATPAPGGSANGETLQPPPTPTTRPRPPQAPRPRVTLDQVRPPPETPPAPAPEAPAEPVCSVTLLSWRTAIHSPWIGPDLSDIRVALPAPPDARYLVLRLAVSSDDRSASRLALLDGPDGSSDVRLVVHGDRGDRYVSSLGRLSDPPDRRLPFDAAPIRLAPGAESVEINLVFVLPARSVSVGVMVARTVVENISLPAAPAPDLMAVAGTWHKLPAQRLHLRYTDPILDALCSPEHRVLSVRRSPENAWLFEFPFTDVSVSPVVPQPGDATFALSLSYGAETRKATARLADEGSLLILYLGESPAERLVYKRAGP